MSLEPTGVHGLLKRHKLFTHKYNRKYCLHSAFFIEMYCRENYFSNGKPVTGKNTVRPA